jgi:hypothetical protein
MQLILGVVAARPEPSPQMCPILHNHHHNKTEEWCTPSGLSTKERNPTYEDNDLYCRCFCTFLFDSSRHASLDHLVQEQVLALFLLLTSAPLCICTSITEDENKGEKQL